MAQSYHYSWSSNAAKFISPPDYKRNQSKISMGTETQRPLRVFFLPLPCPGHMIPTINIAILFARRPDISVTIVTTPGNEHLVRPSIVSSPIELVLVPFPSSVAHLLRDSKENLSSLTNADYPDFIAAFYALQQPIEEILYDRHPDCIVSDYMFTWTSDTALKLNIPRIVFYGHGIFASCVHDRLECDAPYTRVLDDSEVFVVEGLPCRVEMTRSEVSLGVVHATDAMRESVEKSYGILVNSFYELEAEFAELYRRKPGRRAYYVGPVSLFDKEKVDRGQKLSPDVDGLMAWMDSIERGSALYGCFGSLNQFSTDQLREIVLGLEASGHKFVWVVKDIDIAEWLPDGFEERMKGKGVVIRGWAPQVIILNHSAIGGFLTHCGWNSALESISAGVPMVTFPVEYEQFVNEKLITKVLEIGVNVKRDGVKKVVKAKEIASAVQRLMSDEEEAEERRVRVRNYAAKAKAAMEDGGSSYKDMSRLIDEIKELSLKGAK